MKKMESSEETGHKTESTQLADDTSWDELKEYIRDGAEDDVESFLEENSAFNSPDSINRVLHMAVAANRENIIALAINKGADINAVDENGDSPLHIAVRKIHCAGLVKYVIGFGADRELQNNKHKKPLDHINEELLIETKPLRKAKLQSIKMLLIEEDVDIIRRDGHKSTATSNSDLQFECSKGLKVNLTGAMFQTKLLMLFAKRAMDRGCEFRLATEIESAGKFDDVVLRYKENGRIVYRFVQAKHRDNPSASTIRESDMFSSDTNGDFNIIKYFISFINIGNSTTYEDGILKDFIICTNTDLESRVKNYFTCKDLLSHEIMYLHKCAGKKYQLKCENNNINIINYLIRKMKCIALDAIDLKAIENIKEDKIKTVLQIQLELVNKIKNNEISTKTNECDELWTFARIKKEGSKIFENYLNVLAKHKKSIQNAVDKKGKTASETIKEIFPIDGKEPCYSGDLKQLKANASIIIQEHSQKLKNQKRLLLDCCMDDGLIKAKISEFITKFGIVTNYPGIHELNNLISHELGSEFQLLDASFLNDSFEKDMLNWVRSYEKNKAKYFLGKDCKDIFTELTRKLDTLMVSGVSKSYVDQIRQYSIIFERDDLVVMKFLLSDKKQPSKNILHVLTEHIRLSILKLINTLERNTNLQKLDSVIFTSIESIRSTEMCNRIINAFSSNFSHHILVIECQQEPHKHVDYNQFFSAINTILNTNEYKKLILIARSECFVVETLKSRNYYQVFDKIRFNDLEEESRKIILNKDAIFQENRGMSEKKIQLKDLMDDDSMHGIIDEEMLWWLIKTNNIRVGDERAFDFRGYNEEYNIKRTLHYQIIDIKFVLENKTALIFVTGSKDQLDIFYKKIISEHDSNDDFVNIQWWPEVQTETMNFYSRPLVVLSHNDEEENKNHERFKTICQQGSNVYWMVWFTQTKLIWKGFKGPEQYLNELEKKQKELKKPDDYICPFSSLEIKLGTTNKFNPETLEQKVIIVSNGPGEGKSTMLTNLAHNLKKISPHLWIVRVNLTEYAIESDTFASLRNIDMQDGDMEKVIDILAKMIIRGDSNDVNVKFQRQLVKATLNGDAKVKLIVLVDGFDEISPNYEKQTYILLKILKESKASQIWVTTRIHLKFYLEKALQTPAYVLTTLAKEEQVSYLSKYWKWHLKFYKDPPNEITTTGIHDYLKNYQQSISQFIMEYSNISKEIQSQIYEHITEVNLINNLTDATIQILQEKVQELNFSAYATVVLNILHDLSANETTESADYNFTAVPQNLSMLAENMFKRNLQIPKSTGMCELYRQFVLDKLDIYKRKNVSSDDIIAQEQFNIANRTVQRAHRELAVKMLFPDSHTKNVLPEINELGHVTDELRRIGLVKMNEWGLEFTHHTYAEYFLSEYISHNFQNEHVQKDIFTNICLYLKYRVVRLFLNAILFSGDNLSRMRRVRTGWRDNFLKMERTYGKGYKIPLNFQNPLFLAMRERLNGFIQFFLNIDFDGQYEILNGRTNSTVIRLSNQRDKKILLEEIKKDTELFDHLIFSYSNIAFQVVSLEGIY